MTTTLAKYDAQKQENETVKKVRKSDTPQMGVRLCCLIHVRRQVISPLLPSGSKKGLHLPHTSFEKILHC